MLWKYRRLCRETALLLVVIFCFPRVGWPWGWLAHRWVNQQAFAHLPAEMTGFERWAKVVAAHGSDADYRKAWDPLESPRHWIDIDNFPEFYQGHLSHNLDSLKARHGQHMDVYGNGVVPWIIAGVTETLSVAMAAGDWGEAVLLAADLGHYVADCHQPLHTTRNYDGQLTGNKGIHLRYEIDMIRRNPDRLKADPARAVYVEEPLEHIFGTIRRTWSFVDSIMSADCQARKKDPVYGDDYYQVLWEKTGRFTTKQLSRASRILADLWYTAWIDAGRPAFPPAAAVVTCAGLQADPHAQGLMNVQGVVTIGSGVLDREHTRLYIQDQSGRGILVFDHDPVAEDIVRGDLVQVEGIIHDYRGITEVSGPLVTVLDRGCAAVPPRALTTAEANDPEWDGTIIQVRGAVVFILRQERWTRLHLDDGSGAIVVLAWKDTELDLREVQEGDVLTVCGVGTYLADEGSYAILPGYEDQVVREKD